MKDPTADLLSFGVTLAIGVIALCWIVDSWFAGLDFGRPFF